MPKKTSTMQTVNLNKARHCPFSVSTLFYLAFSSKHAVPIRMNTYSSRHKAARC